MAGMQQRPPREDILRHGWRSASGLMNTGPRHAGMLLFSRVALLVLDPPLKCKHTFPTDRILHCLSCSFFQIWFALLFAKVFNTLILNPVLSEKDSSIGQQKEDIHR